MNYLIACLVPCVGLSYAASAGITITNVYRFVQGDACVKFPSTATTCVTSNFLSTTEGFWSKNASRTTGSNNANGSCSVTAQATQESNVQTSGFSASLGVYNAITATGDFAGESRTSNIYSVRFTTPANVNLNLSSTISPVGAYTVTVSKVGGPTVYNSGVSDSTTVALTPGGTWVVTIGAGDGPNCGPCFVSNSSNAQLAVTFDFGACAGDFNGDTFVDDTDFVVFASAYNGLICSNYPTPCTGDLNEDGYVDDSDFVIFAAAYEILTCP